MPTINYTTQLSSTDVLGSITYLGLPTNSPFTGIVPFKYNTEPYGNWPNTTECNIGGDPNKHQCHITQRTYSNGSALPDTLGILNWKCSEVAYHAQKLLDYRQELAKTSPIDQARIDYLDQWIKYMQQLPILPDKSFLPRDHWDPILKQIAQNLGEYDYTNNNYYTFNNKLNAGPNAKENYDRMKFVVGLKVEQHEDLKKQAKFFAENNLIPVECSQYDDTWASGKSGKGKNLLGQIIFELGSKQSNNKKDKQLIEQQYNALKTLYQETLTLPDGTTTTHYPSLSHDQLLSTAAPPKSMSFDNMHYSPNVSATKSITTASKPETSTSPITSCTVEEAKQKIIDAIHKKLTQSPEITIKVTNDINPNKPTQKVLQVIFKTAKEAGDFSKKLNHATIIEENKNIVLLGPEKIKFFFQEQKLNTHLITIIAQGKEEKKVLKKHNETPKERVLDKIPNATNIEIDNNNNLIINFNSQEDADNFSKTNNNVEVKNQNDNFVVILKQDQLNKFLKQHNIATQGKTAQIPMIKALKYEQSCNNIESCFNFKKSTNDHLKDIKYKKLWNAPVAEKVAKNTQDTIGTICSIDPNSKDLAIIKENSIECPTDSNLTPTQNEIFITFLEMHNNPNITIEANNFSPNDLNALLDLLSTKEPKLKVKLELPEQDKCVHGNNEKYTEAEYNDIKAKIDKYHTTLNPSATPKPF